MKRYLFELFQALLIATVLAVPFMLYFWEMTP